MTVCFMLGLVADQTPATSDAIPVISTFYFSVNLVVSASVLFTVFVINFHHRNCHTNEMTPLVRKLDQSRFIYPWTNVFVLDKKYIP